MADLHQHLETARKSFTRIQRAHPGVVLAALVVWVAFTVVVAVGSAGLVYDVFHGLPGDAQLRDISAMAQATTLYDKDNAPAFTIFEERRIEVPLSAVSPNLTHAIIAIEDQRFYDHGGIDLVRIGAAALENLRAGRAAQGGSTLTQQLARQSFLSADKTLRRKLKEAVLAWRIERTFSKNQILEMYLNKVYFGDGLYGIEAASRGYFGKSAGDLSVDEAALLAGLIQSPSSYAPTVNLDRAIARRNVVLQTMVASGAIDQAQYDRARTAKVTLKNALEMKETFGLYFKEHVRRELVEKFGHEAVVWSGTDRTYVLLARARPSELTPVVRYVRANAH